MNTLYQLEKKSKPQRPADEAVRDQNENLNRSVEELELSCAATMLKTRHSVHRRTGPKDRSRNAEDEKFWPQSMNEIKEILPRWA